MTQQKDFTLNDIIETTMHKAAIAGKDFNVFKQSIYSANVLDVTVGTTGPKGGNYSHGCVTYLKISDNGGTDLQVRTSNDQDYKPSSKVEVYLGGDSELTTFIQALEFAVKVLKAQAGR